MERTLKAPAQNKDRFWQAVRGICMIAVVMIHCAYPADTYCGAWEWVYYITWRNLINFPVSVFAFLAGYFIKQDGSFNMRDRLVRLLVPYLIYSCAYFVFGYAAGTRFTLGEYVIRLLVGGAATPFYYIIMLLIFTLLTPLLMKCLQTKAVSILIMALSPVLMLFMIPIGATIHSRIAQLIVLNCGMWLSFYYGGLFARNRKSQIKVGKHLLYALVLLLLVFEIVSSVVLLHSQYSGVAFSQKRVAGVLYSASVILLLLYFDGKRTVKKDSMLSKFLVYVGDNSYGVFYIHCAFLLVLRMVMERVNIAMPLLVLRILEFAVAFGGSLIVIKIIKLIFKKYSKLLFGV